MSFSIRASSLVFSVTLLTAAATSALAAPPAADSRVDIVFSRADLAAAQAVLGTPSFDTAYEMSTGRRLAVSAFGEDELRVRYGRRMPTSLRHDGQGRFLSHDGRLTLRFELDADGQPHQVRLAMPTDWQ